MQWSKRYPEKLGWYWVRGLSFPGKVEIGETAVGPTVSGSAIYFTRGEETYSQDECDGCEFAGPILPPE